MLLTTATLHSLQRCIVFLALNHEQLWVVHWVCLVCVLVAVHCPACCGQQQLQDVRVRSTEYSISVSFVPRSSATNYTVSFRLTNGLFITDFPFSPPYNSSELTQEYTAVLPGHIYTIEIYENGTSIDEKVFAKDMATVPLTPVDPIVLSRGNDFLLLQWVSEDNYTYDGHEISYRRTNGNEEVIKTPQELTYNLTGLEAGYSYDIYIVAVKFGVKSQRSRRLVAATVPLAPVNVTANAVGTNKINITWIPDPNSYQESYIVNYTLPGTEVELSTLCSDTPCVFSPRSNPGETINISVFAVSYTLTSVPSTTQHSTAPGEVTGLTAVQGVRSLDLSWVPPAESYQVYYVITVKSLLDRVEQDFRVSANLTSYKLNSLKGGCMYQVHVQAQSLFELGDSDLKVFYTLPEPVTGLFGSALNSSAIRFTWINPEYSEVEKLNISVFMPKPVPPVIANVVSGETYLNLTLEPSVDLGVYDSLQAMLEDGLVQHIADTNGLVTFSDLEPGTMYIIRAFSLSGQVHSDEISSTLYTRPRPVQDLIVDTLGDQSLSVMWSAPDRGGYDNFTVLVSDVDGITSPVERTMGDLETTFNDLQPGTTYNVSVVVLKGEQRSETAWELNTTIPLPVTHVRVSVRAIDTVTLAWDAPVGSALSGFALTFDPLNLTLYSLPVEVDQYKLEGLEPDTNYTVRVFTYSERSGGEPLYSDATAFNFSTCRLPHHSVMFGFSLYGRGFFLFNIGFTIL
ncbi:protein-tyrosine-phosphatase [Elysia marginata]|uniref:Protein-tyrosine-phosphatase n=1 Tax=Elysia marginata TaxID=1093978 RepID=A0AAV4GKY1_9GAST|nr:protein-tyrosine-phosphatase [Elysia marginata]